MKRHPTSRRLWAWHLSALVYEWSYVHVAHQVDLDVLSYLGDRVLGAVVADCGCGPGVVSEKLLHAGAARVVAIDANTSMIERATSRLGQWTASGQVHVCQASHETTSLREIGQRAGVGQGFDLVLFKRSLYMPRPRALQTLRQAAAALQPQGTLVVVHPERSLRRYAFAPPRGLTSYTLFHLGNRGLSRLMEWCGAEEYTLYTGAELVALVREAVPGGRVTCVPSQQRPYNLVALHMP